MVRFRSWGRLFRTLTLAAVLAGFGCGGSDTADRKSQLSDQEVQRQLKELDAQRREEWGKPKRK